MNTNRFRGGVNVALQWLVGIFGRQTCRNCHWRIGCFKNAMHPPRTLDCCCMWKAKDNAEHHARPERT